MPVRPSRKEYKRVRPTKEEGAVQPDGEPADNEIRVIAARSQRNYISYGIETLTGAEGKKKHDSVVITGMGAAVYNAVNIAEVVKRRVAGLHQTTDISSHTVVDKYEPTEAAKEKEAVTVERKVSTITITLSTTPLDTKHVGYQAPLPEDQVTEQEERPPRSPRKPKAKKAAAPAAAADGEKKEKPAKKERKPKAEGDAAEKKEKEPKEEGAEGAAKGRGKRGGRNRYAREMGDEHQTREGAELLY